MDRSAKNATRFTATSPHAYSTPTLPRRSPSSSSPPSFSQPPPTTTPRFQSPGKMNKFQSPSSPFPPPSSSLSKGPPGETPQQKVARLRAARAKAKMYQLSLWDHIVVQGRFLADRLHRATVTGLIGFTVLSAGLTIYALGDMIVYNRRKRASYYAQKAEERRAALQEAIEAEKDSRPLSDGQAALLALERARLAAEDERIARKWGVRKVGAWLLRGLKGEDLEAWDDARKAGRIVEQVRREEEEARRAEGVVEESAEGSAEASAEGSAGEAQRLAGSLDRMAARAAEMVRLRSGWGNGDAGK